MTNAHVIGAGLAGLSAAIALVDSFASVTIYESGPAAGGRCRSYFDRGLGCRIDNGNHLLLSGNRAAIDYLEITDALVTMTGPGTPLFPFIDLATGERWQLRPNRGRLPWWIFSPTRRVPGTKAADHLSLLALRRASTGTVQETLPAGALYRRLLEPLAIAALNTPPDIALASLLAPVVTDTLARGGHACIPLVPREGLSESFVDPAIAWLTRRGGKILTNRRIAALRIESARIVALQTLDGDIPIADSDAVVLAVPPWVATDLLPGLTAPDEFESILNLHFRIDAEPGPAGFLGVIGGTAEWIFIKPGVVSVTISAANRLADIPNEIIAARAWADLRASLALPEPMPPVRVLREKRATFAATAAQQSRRPAARTAITNLALAGDWTATFLPATIEGAIRSGRAAADCLRPDNRQKP